jgi:hypothetical protein
VAYFTVLEGLMNLKDESYPKELLDKFSPLKCDLCVAKVFLAISIKIVVANFTVKHLQTRIS